MCMNKCICTDESQPTDEEYQMNDEVPLERKPMDCWWEPIAHTAEDRTRHLRRESLDGEAGVRQESSCCLHISTEKN